MSAALLVHILSQNTVLSIKSAATVHQQQCKLYQQQMCTLLHPSPSHVLPAAPEPPAQSARQAAASKHACQRRDDQAAAQRLHCWTPRPQPIMWQRWNAHSHIAAGAVWFGLPRRNAFTHTLVPAFLMVCGVAASLLQNTAHHANLPAHCCQGATSCWDHRPLV